MVGETKEYDLLKCYEPKRHFSFSFFSAPDCLNHKKLSRKIFYTENIQFVFFYSHCSIHRKEVWFLCSGKDFDCSRFFHLFTLSKGEQSDHLNLVATRQMLYI